VAVLVAGVVSPSASADPDPTIAEVDARVSQLHREAEQAIERYNTINEQVEAAESDLSAARADVRALRRDTERLRRQVERLVLAQADATGVANTTAQLLGSEDPDDFLIGLVAMQSASDQSAALLTSYEGARARLDARHQQARDQLAEIAAAKQRAAAEKALTLEKAAAAEELLAELEDARAERRAAAAEPSRADSRPQPSPTDSSGSQTPAEPSPAPVSGGAGTAVATALGQVGDAYAYGAAGPEAFDCSGLTMFAWAAAGVSLPHSASMQAGMGVPVAYSDLQPGDLVFYYSPISHAGMYIGNGQLVHAANESAPVEVVDVDLMPITAIRRVG